MCRAPSLIKHLAISGGKPCQLTLDTSGPTAPLTVSAVSRHIATTRLGLLEHIHCKHDTVSCLQASTTVCTSSIVGHSQSRPAVHPLSQFRGCPSMVSSTHEHHDFVRRNKFPVPVAKEDVQKDWEPRGFSCDVFKDPPGREWRDFKHNDDELIVLVKGHMEVTVGEDRVQLQPGDELFIPAGVLHSTANTGDDVAEWLYGYG